MHRTENGQVLVEFALGVMLVAAVVVTLFAFFKAGWNRFQCVHEVFEEAHAAAHGGRPRFHRFLIIRGPTGVKAIGRCGSALEEVRIANLENMR